MGLEQNVPMIRSILVNSFTLSLYLYLLLLETNRQGYEVMLW